MNTLLSFAAQAGLELTGRVLPTRGSTAWVARRDEEFVILRRLDPAHAPPELALTLDDIAWLHQFLTDLAQTGFPCPVPIPGLDGTSFALHDGALWELVTYLPGNSIGWNDVPTLFDVGQLMARYHQASASIRPRAQRPRAFTVGQLHEAPVDRKLQVLLDELADDLDRIRYHDAPRLVIHGDFTTHNVVASGEPVAPNGVIDFALAHVETPLAELGCSLWRSGRAQQDAVELELERVYDLVRGYADAAPLPPDSADAIATYIRARGVQQAVNSYRRSGRRRPLLIRRARWLATNHAMLSDHVSQALEYQPR
ncbi:MAG: phosphotransferase enzyme family protein [Nocardioidaceae bacterium]